MFVFKLFQFVNLLAICWLVKLRYHSTVYISFILHNHVTDRFTSVTITLSSSASDIFAQLFVFTVNKHMYYITKHTKFKNVLTLTCLLTINNIDTNYAWENLESKTANK